MLGQAEAGQLLGDSPGLRVSVYTCIKKCKMKCKDCNQDLRVNENHRPFRGLVCV